MAGAVKVKVAVRLDEELVSFLDDEVDAHMERGVRCNRSKLISICIRRYQISKLEPSRRAAVFQALGLAAPEEGGRAYGNGGDGEDD